MAVLHLLNRASALQSCLSRVRAADGVVLLGDGVYAALVGSQAACALSSVRDDGVVIYGLAPDLELRGVGPELRLKGLQPVDYAGFVELVIAFPSSCSW